MVTAWGADIKLAAVTHAFVHQNTAVQALSNFNLDITPSEFVSIVGPSGCGKTTVLGMIAGLYHPSAGRVTLDSNIVKGPRSDIAYMLARDALLPWRTARQNVELGLEVRGVKPSERHSTSSEWLARVGLAGFENSSTIALSQGMRQRVAIARTLVLNPRCILMDEPFAALDAQTRLQLQAEFLRLWEATRSTVVFVTHDLVEAVRLSDRVIVVSRRPGRVIEDLRIELPRPREFTNELEMPQFRSYCKRITALLEREVSATE